MPDYEIEDIEFFCFLLLFLLFSLSLYVCVFRLLICFNKITTCSLELLLSSLIIYTAGITAFSYENFLRVD